jgi:hypothetical protein
MAHFAQIQDNVVTQVIVINNATIAEPPLEFPATEGAGIVFIRDVLKFPHEWRQTSYNGSFRYHYAGIGYTWDPDFGEYGAFVPPQPYPSWTLDENAHWQPPVPYPDDGDFYVWDEETQSWVLFVAEE